MVQTNEKSLDLLQSIGFCESQCYHVHLVLDACLGSGDSDQNIRSLITLFLLPW